VDAAGRLLALEVLPGQRHDLDAARALLAALPGRPGRVVGDRGFSAAWLRADIPALGAEPCVPAQPTHPPAPFDPAAYARRNLVERFWGRMKEWRGVAARHDKTVACYRAGNRPRRRPRLARRLTDPSRTRAAAIRGAAAGSGGAMPCPPPTPPWPSAVSRAAHPR